MKEIKRIMVKEKLLLEDELVGSFESIIDKLDSYKREGYNSIEVVLERSAHSPLQFNRTYWLVKTRLENDEEYENRMRLEMKQQEKERIQKEKRREQYEKLRKEFE